MPVDMYTTHATQQRVLTVHLDKVQWEGTYILQVQDDSTKNTTICNRPGHEEMQHLKQNCKA